MSNLSQKIGEQVGLKLVEIVTRPDNIPFYRGDLRKSIVNQVIDSGADTLVIVGTNLSYAKDVHNGRKALVIRPRKAKILAWWTNPEKTKKLVPFPHGKAFKKAIENKQIRVSKRVLQPARAPDPFLINALKILQYEGMGFLAPLLKKHTVQELEQVLRQFQDDCNSRSDFGKSPGAKLPGTNLPFLTS